MENNPINFIDPEGLMARRPETKAEKVKKWKDNFDKYKGLYDACKGDMNDPNNCEQCCKKIAQSFPHTSIDASGWWIMYNQCKAAMCLECQE